MKEHAVTYEERGDHDDWLWTCRCGASGIEETKSEAAYSYRRHAGLSKQ